VRVSKAGRQTETEDLNLLVRIRGGDRRAFEELYKIYQPRLARFLFNLVRRPQLVDEVLDDTLMVVWERPHSFRGASKLSTWIFAIAYRKAIKAARGCDEPVDDPNADQRPSPAGGPDEAVARQRKQALLIRAMEELSPEHRAVVDLTYFHEMEYREIADILGCPVDTVKTRMFHARRRLRRRMEGDLADWL
jgi:RNA polymerase sigma factor (sigma-70 family)